METSSVQARPCEYRPQRGTSVKRFRQNKDCRRMFRTGPLLDRYTFGVLFISSHIAQLPTNKFPRLVNLKHSDFMVSVCTLVYKVVSVTGYSRSAIAKAPALSE